MEQRGCTWGWEEEAVYSYEEVDGTIIHEWDGSFRWVECGAPVTETDRGWHCEAGHSHDNEAQYFDEDEIAGRFWFPANALRMDGSPV